MPMALQANLHYTKRVKEMMDRQFRVVPAGAGIDEVTMDDEDVTWFVAADAGQIAGLASKEDVLRARQSSRGGSTVGDIIIKEYVLVEQNAALFDLMVMMRSSEASVALVLEGSHPIPDRVRGIITSEKIGLSMCQAMDMFT